MSVMQIESSWQGWKSQRPRLTEEMLAIACGSAFASKYPGRVAKHADRLEMYCGFEEREESEF